MKQTSRLKLFQLIKPLTGCLELLTRSQQCRPSKSNRQFTICDCVHSNFFLQAKRDSSLQLDMFGEKACHVGHGSQ